jgi:hypothetical protein
MNVGTFLQRLVMHSYDDQKLKYLSLYWNRNLLCLTSITFYRLTKQRPFQNSQNSKYSNNYKILYKIIFVPPHFDCPIRCRRIMNWVLTGGQQQGIRRVCGQLTQLTDGQVNKPPSGRSKIALAGILHGSKQNKTRAANFVILQTTQCAHMGQC